MGNGSIQNLSIRHPPVLWDVSGASRCQTHHIFDMELSNSQKNKEEIKKTMRGNGYA
jgi:hypothetical protein